MAKSFVCTCEDVTHDDLMHMIQSGFHDLESVKRYSGIGTGYCQGKMCLTNTAKIVEGFLQNQDNMHTELLPTTARPPLHPLPLKYLAAHQPDVPIYPKQTDHLGVPPVPLFDTQAVSPLPESCSTVIIGGGIIGLALAYNLALQGHKDVVVLERSYINSGASGRCGGGIREQWSSKQNVILMKESIQILKSFAQQMHINIWFRQGGYLFLTDNEQQQSVLERNAAMQNELGVPTKLLTPQQAKKIVPQLHLDKMLVASYNPEDGILFPWPVLWGYVNAAREAGVTIADFTEVTGMDYSQETITKVHTTRGSISCDLVVNATAAWAPKIGNMVNLQLPNKPERHEILVSEPLKPFLNPMVSVLSSGLYFSQSMRGEIVGGMGDPQEPATIEMRSSLRFLNRFATSIVSLLPQLGDVKILRQWAGCYDKTADGNPILGFPDGYKNFFQLHGFMGHGFMMAPVVGKIVSEYIARGTDHSFIKNNNLSRFLRDDLETEDMIIG